MPVEVVIGNVPVPVYIWTRNIDDNSMEQLSDLAHLPFVKPHIAVMPDVHYGLGSTIGSVIPTVDAVIPASVGVDIGCGMSAVRTRLTGDQLRAADLPDIRARIEAKVPVGFNWHKENSERRTEKTTALDVFYDPVEEAAQRYIAGFEGKQARRFRNGLPHRTRWSRQLGTLGGGNHFIELCVDEDDLVWLMLHTGSRGIGNSLAQVYIQVARNRMAARGDDAPNRDLNWLVEGENEFDDYLAAVSWAQLYAQQNRLEIVESVFDAMAEILPDFWQTQELIDCHHNFVQREVHMGHHVLLTRKGAIQAEEGQLGIIPGSMGQRSFIVSGFGAELAFRSASHGAGRVMSRTQAKRQFTMEDLAEQTAGVELRRHEKVIDEIPGAYKNIEEVMKDQTDLVKIEHRLKQVVCVKG